MKNEIDNQPDDTERREVDFSSVSKIISILESLDKDTQNRILNTVMTWLDIETTSQSVIGKPNSANSNNEALSNTQAEKSAHYEFSNNESINPKEFMLEKNPGTDVERLACLAYYLTHFCDQPHFKTLDLSKLNTEAAQRKFANAANTAKNAVRDGLLVAAPKTGYRQLSAQGEQYVQALPDREAAKEVKNRISSRRKSRSSKKKR